MQNLKLTKLNSFQDCCQYHQAKDGDGWVEYKGSLSFDRPNKVCTFSRIEILSFKTICFFCFCLYILVI